MVRWRLLASTKRRDSTHLGWAAATGLNRKGRPAAGPESGADAADLCADDASDCPKRPTKNMYDPVRKKYLAGAMVAGIGMYLLLSGGNGGDAPAHRGVFSRTAQLESGDETRSMVMSEVSKALVDEVARLRSQIATGNVGSSGGPWPPVASLHPQNKMRILVTGGAGFVGSNLVDRLMGEGHEVIVLDNMFTGRKENIAHWFGHPHFQLIVGDVVEPIMLEVDQIYHLACPASPPHYQYNPIKTIKTSTEGTLNMLGLAKRVSARMLLTSTSEVYGDPEVHPQPETYWGHVNPIGPRACYDEGKRVAETMMYSYKSQANVEVRVARIFNTFGPRMHPNDGRVVSNFIIQALQGRQITIYGNGLQTRSFQYVEDLVDCLHRLMNGDYDQPVNCGNPEEFTVKSFAESVRDLVKSNSTIANLPATEDDPRQRKPDITVAREQLGWAPRWHVRDGLERTVKYFANELARSGGVIIPTGPGAAKPKPKEDE